MDSFQIYYPTLLSSILPKLFNKKALAHANTIPPFVILTSIAKELADTMQVWTINESACPPAIRKLPDQTLHLPDVDFYISLRKILLTEDNKVFKTQLWKLFQLNNFFKILTNDVFHHNGSINDCLQLSAHKKCPPLDVNLEPSFLTQWLRDNAGLTTQLVEEIIKPYAI